MSMDRGFVLILAVCLVAGCIPDRPVNTYDRQQEYAREVAQRDDRVFLPSVSQVTPRSDWDYDPYPVDTWMINVGFEGGGSEPVVFFRDEVLTIDEFLPVIVEQRDYFENEFDVARADLSVVFGIDSDVRFEAAARLLGAARDAGFTSVDLSAVKSSDRTVGTFAVEIESGDAAPAGAPPTVWLRLAAGEDGALTSIQLNEQEFDVTAEGLTRFFEEAKKLVTAASIGSGSLRVEADGRLKYLHVLETTGRIFAEGDEASGTYSEWFDRVIVRLPADEAAR